MLNETLDLFKPTLLYNSRERYFACSIDGEADVVYGRVAVEGDEQWAQYWFWYERDWSPLPWRRGHEGDWEMIQLLLTDDPPSVAVYAQHSNRERRSWPSGVDWRTDGYPAVYVSLGKHASYFTPGLHRRGRLSYERADGRGRTVSPRLLEMPDDGWASTAPDRWGSNEHSPRAPGRHQQWARPSTWARRTDT